MSLLDVALIVIVTLGFTTEAAIGFGATLITVSLGSLISPIDALLYAFVPCNVVLSLVVLFRSRKHLDSRALFFGILPMMALGLPIGIFAFKSLPTTLLKRGFGVFVAILGAIELLRMVRKKAEERPLPRALALGLLFLGGVVHGAFATGGPPVVYVCGRTIKEKGPFRSTLAALWALLNLVLVGVYLQAGHINTLSLRKSATLVPGLLIGISLGEVAHGRISEKFFRLVVFLMLVVVGVVLAVRA